MDYEYWFKQGDEFTPITFSDDGSVTVITGLLLLSSLEAMKGRAKKIWEVNDLLNPTAVQIVWDDASL